MFAEDVDSFLDVNDFALNASYDGGTAVAVIFDNEYIQAVTGVWGRAPTAMGKAADFLEPVGKRLEISGHTYMIRDHRPFDDGAMVLLDLKGPVPPAGGDFLFEDGSGAIDLEAGGKLKQESPDQATIGGLGGKEDDSGSILLEDGSKLKEE